MVTSLGRTFFASAFAVVTVLSALGASSAKPPDCTETWKGRRPPVDEVRAGKLKMLCWADLSGADLTEAELDGANLTGARLSRATLSLARLDGANLSKANLTAASLEVANLSRADLRDADLTDVNAEAGFLNAGFVAATLDRATLRRARLTNADFTGASLRDVELADARLVRALLKGANLYGARLGGTILARADLTDASLAQADLGSAKEWFVTNLCRAYFEPKTPPPPVAFAQAVNFWAMRYDDSPAALAAMRAEFKKSELLEQERELTFALRRTRAVRVWEYRDLLNEGVRALANAAFFARAKTWYREYWYPQASLAPCMPEQLTAKRPTYRGIGELPTVWEKVESLFSFVVFNLTSAYGMYPGRPMRILAVSLVLFTIPYVVALNRVRGGGIWAVLLADRVRRRKPRGDPMVRVTVRGLAAKPERSLRTAGPGYMVTPLRIGWRIVATAFYFSLLSAFSIGWRELNVGTWLTRVQRREYTLRGTGWVRTVSGLQALISVYLVALWALTYFSRPFE